jgi:diguanylate cyclase (GGDEF)-like protein/PAS domain S-box-containing protein
VKVTPAREASLQAIAPGEAIVVLDVDGRVTLVTDSIEKLLGYSAEEYSAIEPIDLVHPADRAVLRRKWRELIEAPGARKMWEARTRTSEGNYRWYEVVMINLLDDPEVAGVLNSITDISARRAPEPDSEFDSQFEQLVQGSPDVIASLHDDGTVSWVSGAITELLGWSPEDMVGRPVFEFIEPDDLPAALERFARALGSIESVDPITLRARHRDGSNVVVEVAGSIITDQLSGTSTFVINIRDVSWRQDAIDALRNRERLFRTVAQSSPIGIYQQDANNECIYVNETWTEITGMSFDEARGSGWRRIMHHDDVDAIGLPDVGRTPGALHRNLEFRVMRPDGDVRWVTVRAAPLLNAEGELVGTVGTLDDITERRQTERERQRLIDIFEATEDFVGICDTDTQMLYMNAAAKRIAGMEPDESIAGRTVADTFPPSVAERLSNEIRPIVERTGKWYGELTVARPEGGLVPVAAQLLMHVPPEGGPPYFSAVLHDISERKAFEHRLAHQATHDPLTGLPNRTLLLDRLEGALARARRHQRRVAVLFLDLDHFKVVNDSLGHGLGDRLLMAIAERLTVALRPGDTVARFGGDEFVILCEDLQDDAEAIVIAERVDQALSHPFAIDQTEVFVGVSIGIAMPDGDDAEAETLIRDADAAMYRAKDRGRARWELFDNAMRASAVDRLDIENALRRALERRELRVFYQPIIDLRTGAVDGVEALLRWEHPERGLLPPLDFITVAEETGLIVPIGSWVLDQACRQVQRWQSVSPGSAPLRVSVNISGRQLGHPRLVEDVAAILDDTGINPAHVELEITESVLMDDVEMSSETLGRLHTLGVKLAVDDFGTGYSSLSYLRRFPVDLLKVDRSFVDGLGEDPSDSAIVTAIITLAHALGLSAVAEGVESPLQLAELRRLGCDRAQGYFMARPAGGHEVGEIIAAGRRW